MSNERITKCKNILENTECDRKNTVPRVEHRSGNITLWGCSLKTLKSEVCVSFESFFSSLSTLESGWKESSPHDCRSRTVHSLSDPHPERWDFFMLVFVSRCLKAALTPQGHYFFRVLFQAERSTVWTRMATLPFTLLLAMATSSSSTRLSPAEPTAPGLFVYLLTCWEFYWLQWRVMQIKRYPCLSPKARSPRDVSSSPGCLECALWLLPEAAVVR